MDYLQLNLLFGLLLILTLGISIGLRILLSKMSLPGWMSILSWASWIAGILAALYIESLFLRYMTPTFNRQIGLGLLIIWGILAVVTAGLYRKEISSRTARFLFGAQLLTSLVSLVLALGLYRSLVPI
jgi:hypothetical protein